jgi:hypothetical protein
VRPAIILYRQVDRDDNGRTSHEDNYYRVKILTAIMMTSACKPNSNQEKLLKLAAGERFPRLLRVARKIRGLLPG